MIMAKKSKTEELTAKEEMRSEYDFSIMKGGVRGKYYRSYRDGHNVVIHREDGIDSVQYFTLEDGAIMLEPDVRKYFSTSDDVNKALRSIIDIIPVKRNASAHQKG